jgi:hypothetical protein
MSVALGDLRAALLISLIANLLAAVLILVAGRRLPADEQGLLARARAAGEP